MVRDRNVSWAAGLLMVLAAGCSQMCQSPFDYCGPVLRGNGCPDCNFNARYNSAFAPTDDTPAPNVVAITPGKPESNQNPRNEYDF